VIKIPYETVQNVRGLLLLVFIQPVQQQGSFQDPHELIHLVTHLLTGIRDVVQVLKKHDECQLALIWCCWEMRPELGLNYQAGAQLCCRG